MIHPKLTHSLSDENDKRASTKGSESRRKSSPSLKRNSLSTSSESFFSDLSTLASNLFAQLDVDKQGYLKPEVVRKALKSMSPCDVSRANLDNELTAIWQGLDFDGDGRVSESDFIRCVNSIGLKNATFRTSIKWSKSTSCGKRNSRDGGPIWSSSISHSRSSTPSRQGSLQACSPSARVLVESNGMIAKEYVSQCNSMPDLTLIDECLGSLKCQDYIYDLQHHLRSTDPEMLTMYEYIINDLILNMGKQREAQTRLEKQLESERVKHTSTLQRMSDEMDQQVQLVEAEARRMERANAYTELRSQLEAKSKQVEQLLDRLQQTSQFDEESQQHQDDNSHRERYQSDLDEWRSNKDMIEDRIAQTEAVLGETRLDLESLRKKIQGRTDQDNANIIESLTLIEENCKLQQKVEMLVEVNQELCDTNDIICVILESNLEPIAKISRLHDAVGAYSNLCESIKTRLSQLDNCGVGEEKEQLEPSSSSKPIDRSQLRLPIRSRLSQPTGDADNTTPIELMHLDSGLSSLRDTYENGFDLINEFKVLNQFESSGSPTNTHNPIHHSEITVHCRSNQSETNLHVDARTSSSPSVSKHNLRSISQELTTPGSGVGEKKPVSVFRVMLAGDPSVGKTCIFRRLCQNTFSDNTSATIGVDMSVYPVEIGDRSVVIQLWDTAGQERFRSLSANFFRKSDGVCLVYDCTLYKTFSSIRNWADIIHIDLHDIILQNGTDKEVPLVVLGNKIDLRDNRRPDECVSETDGRSLARNIGALFFETSAKSGINVKESMDELAELLCAKEEYHLRKPTVQLDEESSDRKVKCCN